MTKNATLWQIKLQTRCQSNRINPNWTCLENLTRIDEQSARSLAQEMIVSARTNPHPAFIGQPAPEEIEYRVILRKLSVISEVIISV